MNTKIKCVYVHKIFDDRGFEQGQIYNVVNGKLIFPDGKESYTTFTSVEQINETFYAYFQEIKEEDI